MGSKEYKENLRIEALSKALESYGVGLTSTGTDTILLRATEFDKFLRGEWSLEEDSDEVLDEEEEETGREYQDEGPETFAQAQF